MVLVYTFFMVIYDEIQVKLNTVCWFWIFEIENFIRTAFISKVL